jgi:hypothetical protein
LKRLAVDHVKAALIKKFDRDFRGIGTLGTFLFTVQKTTAVPLRATSSPRVQLETNLWLTFSRIMGWGAVDILKLEKSYFGKRSGLRLRWKIPGHFPKRR